jgi:hypothetical protein
MPTALHLLTRPSDALAAQIIACQQAGGHTQVRVVDLTEPEPDYEALLTEIFAADAVSVW